MALGVIKLTALQTTALAAVYKVGHAGNISTREFNALNKKGVLDCNGTGYIVTSTDYSVNADGIQCLIEAGVINEAAPVTSEVETPAAPELSETEIIALMLIKDGCSGEAIRSMTSELIDWNSMLGRGWLMRHSAKKPECLIISFIASEMLSGLGV